MKPSSTSASEDTLDRVTNSGRATSSAVIGINQIVNLVHLSLFHQEFDEIDRRSGHALANSWM